MSSNVATNRTNDVINHPVSIVIISIIVAAIGSLAIYAMGIGLSLPLRTSWDNGGYFAMGMLLSLVLISWTKSMLNQGDLTKMDVVLLAAMTVAGTHIYVSLTNGTHFTGAYLSLAATVVLRLLLIVVARDIVAAMRRR